MVAKDKINNFKTPSWKNKVANYYFWQRIPKKSEIKKQLYEMKKAGFGSFQIATRLSYPKEEYLSKAYLDACFYTAKLAHKLDLSMGIYDDYNWQSGHAAGLVVKDHDNLRESHLLWTCANIDDFLQVQESQIKLTISNLSAPDATCLEEPGMSWIYENGKCVFDNFKVVSIFIKEINTNKVVSFDELINTNKLYLTHSDNSCTLFIDKDVFKNYHNIKVYAFIAGQVVSSRMVNYLLKDTASRFIECNLAKYKKALGQYWGSTVKYCFYDQPHSCFYNWSENKGKVLSSLMYSDELIEILKQQEIDFHSILLNLIEDLQENKDKASIIFFNVYKSLAINNYFKTIQEWCHQNNILLSGHEVLNHVGSFDFTAKFICDDSRTNFGMDYFLIDSFRDLTACDATGNSLQISAKLADSVAHANNRSGCIVEHYYGSDTQGTHFAVGKWETTLNDLLIQGTRHLLLGARQFLFHAFYLDKGNDSLDIFVNPRLDFAPGINYEPWFEAFKYCSSRLARISSFLDNASEIANVALLYPRVHFYVYGVSSEVGKKVQDLATFLTNESYEYLFFDEANLDINNIKDGYITIGNVKYQNLVLPNFKIYENENTIRTLLYFLDNGGKVFVFEDYENSTDRINEEILKVVRHKNCTLYKNTDERSLSLFNKELQSIYKDLISVSFDKENFNLLKKLKEDRGVYYLSLFNDNKEDLNVFVDLKTKHSKVGIWNADNGKIKKFIYEKEFLPLTIKPLDTVLLTVKSFDKKKTILNENWQLVLDKDKSQKIATDKSWTEQNLLNFANSASYTLDLHYKRQKNSYLYLIVPKVLGSVLVYINGKLKPFNFLKQEIFIKEKEINNITIKVMPPIANKYYKDAPYFDMKKQFLGILANPYLLEYCEG